MIKAIAKSEVKSAVIAGLSHMNLQEIQKGHPVHFYLSELDPKFRQEEVAISSSRLGEHAANVTVDTNGTTVLIGLSNGAMDELKKGESFLIANALKNVDLVILAGETEDTLKDQFIEERAAFGQFVDHRARPEH